MYVGCEIEGLNPERLLGEAARTGIALHKVRRCAQRRICVRVSPLQLAALTRLCEEGGWALTERCASRGTRAMRLMKRRASLPAAALLCAALVWAGSQVILRVEVHGAQMHAGEVRRCLQSAAIRPGRLKTSVSTDALRDRLLLELPGIAYAGVRFAGSVLIVDVKPVTEGGQQTAQADAGDLVAAEDGIVIALAVSSGTPKVKAGQAVRRGQILVSGTERTQGGAVRPVRAQGEVIARVFAVGSASVSLRRQRLIPTGRTGRRVELVTPVGRYTVRDAPEYEVSLTQRMRQPLVGLYVPVYRVLTQTEEVRVRTERADEEEAERFALEAAEQQAKKECPYGAEILDKWVDYSMIDDESIYARVVLQMQRNIAVHSDEYP